VENPTGRKDNCIAFGKSKTGRKGTDDVGLERKSNNLGKDELYCGSSSNQILVLYHKKELYCINRTVYVLISRNLYVIKKEVVQGWIVY
jgi:hypothetical protein